MKRCGVLRPQDFKIKALSDVFRLFQSASSLPGYTPFYAGTPTNHAPILSLIFHHLSATCRLDVTKAPVSIFWPMVD